MKFLRILGLQPHEWILICAVTTLAALFALTVHGYSKRFETELAQESQANHHRISELVTTLASLERSIRTSEARLTRERLSSIRTSVTVARELVEARQKSHTFLTDGPYSQALARMVPLMNDVESWLTDGFASLSPSDPIVLRATSQQIYLTKLHLRRSASEANAGTMRLLAQQSGQISNFAGVVILLIGTMCVMMIWAWLLHAKNRRSQARLWHERKLTSDSINNINEGFVLTDANGKVLVVNETLPRLSPALGKQLESFPYSMALANCINANNLSVSEQNDEAQKLALRSSDQPLDSSVVDNQPEDSTEAPTTAVSSEHIAAHAQVMELLTEEGLSLRVTNKLTGDGGRVITFTNISDLKATQEKLHLQANYDYLTGIANRSYYVMRLNEALAAARRHGHKVALMQFDLDKFKQVNDTLGHDVGDKLLISTASRIKSNLREFDLAARIGGDEFAAILDHVKSEDEVVATADRIINELREVLEIDGVKIDFSASIGVAIFPDHASDIESLIKHADIACYRAKDSGRNNYKLYGADMKVEALQLRTLETKLRRAIDRDELSLIYQQQMQLEDGSVKRVEAFSRWHDVKLGNVPPHQFIPIAEKSGQIAKLGEQVLEKAYKQLHQWREQGINDVTIAVNITKRNLFLPTLPETLDRLSSRYGLSASKISFEITEDSISEDPLEAANVLNVLAERGVHFIIDDYGMGTSSLPRIKQLPIDALKIDGEFTTRLTEDQSARDIVAAIISSATSLRIDTVAENVETTEQIEILREMGCTAVQGYYVGQLQSAEELTEELLSIENQNGGLKRAG